MALTSHSAEYQEVETIGSISNTKNYLTVSGHKKNKRTFTRRLRFDVQGEVASAQVLTKTDYRLSIESCFLNEIDLKLEYKTNQVSAKDFKSFSESFDIKIPSDCDFGSTEGFFELKEFKGIVNINGKQESNSKLWGKITKVNPRIGVACTEDYKIKKTIMLDTESFIYQDAKKDMALLKITNMEVNNNGNLFVNVNNKPLLIGNLDRTPQQICDQLASNKNGHYTTVDNELYFTPGVEILLLPDFDFYLDISKNNQTCDTGGFGRGEYKYEVEGELDLTLSNNIIAKAIAHFELSSYSKDKCLNLGKITGSALMAVTLPITIPLIFTYYGAWGDILESIIPSKD